MTILCAAHLEPHDHGRCNTVGADDWKMWRSMGMRFPHPPSATTVKWVGGLATTQTSQEDV